MFDPNNSVTRINEVVQNLTMFGNACVQCNRFARIKNISNSVESPLTVADFQTDRIFDRNC